MSTPVKEGWRDEEREEDEGFGSSKEWLSARGKGLLDVLIAQL